MARHALIIGAHPDDADYRAGGTAALWRQAGVQVTFVSVTDGSAGHNRLSGAPLAAKRREEAARAGKRLGLDYRVLNYPDGRLEPTLDARLEILRLIRSLAPDLVLTHRPNDYHPDHRYVAQLVQDAAYMVIVPSVAPETPALTRNPVFGYMGDFFTRPTELRPDFLVPVDDQVHTLIDLFACHDSQFLEWLPFALGLESAVPKEANAQRTFLSDVFLTDHRRMADRFRPLLVERFGDARGNQIKHVEAFEVSEYGAPLDDELRHDLFGFLSR